MYTNKECAEIALNKAGELYSNVYQYDQISLPPEWGWRRVATGGMGNRGSAVLVGKTKETRELLRQGKIKKLMSTHPELTYVMADTCVSIRWGMEYRVVKAAILHKNNPLWHADWEKGPWLGFLELGDIKDEVPFLSYDNETCAAPMSCPRWLATHAIIREWWRTGAVDTPPAVDYFDEKGRRLNLGTQSVPAHIEGRATFNPFKEGLKGLKP